MTTKIGQAVWLTTLFMVALFVAPAQTADFQAGLEAYERGDFAAALHEWRPLAEQGHAWAQHNLGAMYVRGSGVPQDDIEAVKWTRKAAYQGLVAAQFKMGIMYIRGKGVPENDVEAVKWLRMAAEQGNAEAQIYLGHMYNKGKGVSEDDAEAAKWYRKAAEQGIARAQANLGLRYYLGEGLPEDDMQAYAWLNIAVAQGEKEVETIKKAIAASMTRERLARAQELARDYWERYVLPFQD